MYSRALLAVCFFALMHSAYSHPKGKSFATEVERENSAKEWEANKPEISLLRELEKSGIGVKRSMLPERDDGEGRTGMEVVESVSSPSPSAPAVPPNELKPEEIDSLDDETATRVKKQSPTNVCIKVGGCGKTACGPIVSARGPVVGDVRAMMQNVKSPMPATDDVHPATFNDMSQGPGKIQQFSPVQGRTVDLMGLAPTLSFGYGTPAVYSAPMAPATSEGSLGYGHSFVKPPAVQTVPAVPVAVITQHQPHPMVHPSWLMPSLLSHLMPHVMPHLVPSMMPSLTSYIPHRFEPQRFPEVPQTEVKQPVSPASQFSYVNPDNALICQPVRNQRFDSPYEYMYKPDMAIDKSLNVSEAAKKFPISSEDDSKIQDHLRKVNEIKEEISQLNRAAQRIVDQQERLTEMQQKHLWSGSSAATTSMHSSDHAAAPYMGNGYYTHQTMPWGYSRSNILSYPNTHDDIEFFLNLLRTGKKFGVISDSLQPVLSTVGEVIKGGQEASKLPKDVGENAKTVTRMDDSKSSPVLKTT